MIYLATDHRGFLLKEKLKIHLTELGYQYHDFGAFSHDPEDDYPDFVHQAAEQLSKNPDGNCAIILGASGQGEAMVANRYPGVRAIVYYGGPHEILRLGKEHNNSNALSLGAAFLNEEEMKSAVNVWIDSAFSGEERHVRRIKKIDQKISNS